MGETIENYQRTVTELLMIGIPSPPTARHSLLQNPPSPCNDATTEPNLHAIKRHQRSKNFATSFPLSLSSVSNAAIPQEKGRNKA